jgi:hypothetical protein
MSEVLLSTADTDPATPVEVAHHGYAIEPPADHSASGLRDLARAVIHVGVGCVSGDQSRTT